MEEFDRVGGLVLKIVSFEVESDTYGTIINIPGWSIFCRTFRVFFFDVEEVWMCASA